MGLCFISHFNRLSMSVAGTERLMPDYGISPKQMGVVYSSFLLVYTILMIPGGLLLDRIGPRRALMLVGFGSAVMGAGTGILGWLFPPIRGALELLVPLLVVRCIMGAVSTPLHPSLARFVANWFPQAQRNVANGLVTGAALAGVASTYYGFGAAMREVGWQAAFIGSALITCVLTTIWSFSVKDHPPGSSQPEVKPGPTSASQAGSLKVWLSLLRSRSLLLLTFSYAAVGYFQYLFFYWMQHYFNGVLKLSDDQSRIYATLPTIAMAFTMPAGGWLADVLGKEVGVRRGRALISGIAMAASAVFLGLGVCVKSPIWIAAWFTLALGALGASEGPFWATAVELGGRRAGGAAAAILNFGGNLGGVFAPSVTPWASERWGWPVGISLGAIICFLGALCWAKIDPKPPDEDSQRPTLVT